MSAVAWFGVTLAFLAPPPPPRREIGPPPRRYEWFAALVMGCVVVIMVLPMITIWSFHRPEDGVRARCALERGHLVLTARNARGPYRCGHSDAEANALVR